MGEITTKAYVDILKIVRDTITRLVEIIHKHFELRPAGIIKMLDLGWPIYKQTAAYRHFARNDLDLPLEKQDKVEILENNFPLYKQKNRSVFGSVSELTQNIRLYAYFK